MAGTGSTCKETSILYRTADATVNNDNTVNNDAQLFVPIAVNEILCGRITFIFSANIAGGFRCSFAVPAGAFAAYGGFICDDNVVLSDSMNNGGGSADMAILAVDGSGYLDLYVVNGATPGNISFAWAQHTANANVTTLRRGSGLILHRI